MVTTREVIAIALNESQLLKNLGLGDNRVFQADTVESPKVDEGMFLVIRWGTERPGMGPVSIRPFDLYAYDRLGDPTAADRLVKAAADVAAGISQTPVEGGLLSQVVKGLRGADMQDDGYRALVVPHSMTARASGV